MQPVTHQGRLSAGGFRFALVSSRWNDFLTARLVEGALDALERLGADEGAVEHFRVPGSFESLCCGGNSSLIVPCGGPPVPARGELAFVRGVS